MSRRIWLVAAIAALVAVSCAASAGAATETRSQYVTRGLDYLHGQQRQNGGFGTAPDTAMAILGAVASGERMSSTSWHVKGKNPYDFLQASDLAAASSRVDNAPVYYSRLIMAYVALGRVGNIGTAGSKRIKLLDVLKSYQDTADGSPIKGAFAPTPGSVFAAVRTTSWAILALHHADVPHGDAGFASAAAWLAAQQNADGGFSANEQGGASNALDTALAYQALKVSIGNAQWDPGAARAFLDAEQRSNGGFSSSASGGADAEATAAAVQAILAMGENPAGSAWTTGGKTPFTALGRLLTSNGSYRLSTSSHSRPIIVTGWVLTAFSRKPFTAYPKARGTASTAFKFRPSITSASPKNGARFTTTRVVLIKAAYTDFSPKGTGVLPSASRVYVNGQNRTGAAVIGSTSLRLLLKNVPNGQHTFRIVLRDRAGNSRVLERRFTVAIPEPPGSSSGGSSGGTSGGSTSQPSFEPDEPSFPTDDGADDEFLPPITDDEGDLGETAEPFPFPTPTESASPLITGSPLPSPSGSASAAAADGDGGSAAGYVGGTLLAMLPVGAVVSYLLLQRRALALGTASRGTVLDGGGSAWERFKHQLARSKDLTRPVSRE